MVKIGWKSFDQFARGVGLEIAGIALVGIDVNFEFETFIHTAKHLVQSDAAIAGDLEFHMVALFHSVKFCIGRSQMNVAHGADDAFRHLKKSSRAHKHATERSFDIAGTAQGQFKPECNAVGIGELDLVQISARAEDTEIGDDAAARPDERESFFGSELAVLIEPLVNGELMAFTK